MFERAAQDDMDMDEEWIPDEDVTPTMRARILCLKICRNRSMSHASSDKAMDMSTPTMKLFATILDHNGSPSGLSGERYVRSVLLGVNDE